MLCRSVSAALATAVTNGKVQDAAKAVALSVSSKGASAQAAANAVAGVRKKPPDLNLS